ncbi:IMPACT family protein [Pseudofulvibacter geojedonensis]|uniref:IMPACT family protein n=1 Tax=Pseudofulvibacter geojedonensis TaxID=1123758 RepID=A0ABW3HZ66_9FLAO
MKVKDTYKTIEKPFKGELFKDRGSKFYGYAYPIQSEEDVKPLVEQLKKEHYNARHWCYAWQLGTSKIRYRANDDGEPSNSAGPPIYGQIQAFDVTNVLVVVVRYFGGTKLGVGGLMNANKTASKSVLEIADIIEKTIDRVFHISFEYKDMNKVMRIIKEQNLTISHQKLELKCEYTLPVRMKDADKIYEIFDNFYGVEIKELES